MPAEYMACVKSETARGKSRKVAQRMCAISYFKRHGISVNEAHKKGVATELGIEDNDFDVMNKMVTNLKDIQADSAVQASIVFREADTISKVESPINIDFLKEFGVVEIIATKVGSRAYTKDGRALVWTKKAIVSTAPSWKMKPVSANHEKKNYGLIIDAWEESDEVRMTLKVNEYMTEWLLRASDLIGTSIEAVDVKSNEDFEIIGATGSGVTFVFPPHEPACSIQEGCKVIAENIDYAELEAFVPPEAGTLPDEGKKILMQTYNECRTRQEKEGKTDKEYCSKVSWVAVHNAGFKKDDKGIWVKATEETDKNVLNIQPLNNINDSNISNVSDTKILETQTGDMMAEETKNVIEASVHATMIAEKDSVIAQKTAEIETVKKEMESLKATVAIFEDEKRQKLLGVLKESGVDTEAYKDICPKTLEKMIGAIEAYKKKLDAQPEVNSGAVIEKPIEEHDPSKEVVANMIDATETKDKLSKEEEDKLWASRNEFYGTDVFKPKVN